MSGSTVEKYLAGLHPAIWGADLEGHPAGYLSRPCRPRFMPTGLCR